MVDFFFGDRPPIPNLIHKYKLLLHRIVKRNFTVEGCAMQTVCSIKNKKMMLWIIIVSAFLLVLLIVRLAVIQFVDGNKLKQMAYEQQTLNRKITSKRGTIYDATGKNVLAQSSTVETVTVNSINIPEDKKESVSRALSFLYLPF